MKPQATSPSASTVSLTFLAVPTGRVAARAARRASLNGLSATPRSPWAASSAEDGWGLGTQLDCPFDCSGTGFRSNSTVAMSMPETPSTSAWWVLVMIATRFPSRPCTSHISHSGLERSSACEKRRPVMFLSCSSEPGEGRAEWRTW